MYLQTSITLALLVGALLLWAGPAPASPDEPPAGESKPPKIADFGWLTGRWQAQEEGVTWEETWSVPQGNSIFAMTRMIKHETAGLYELSLIEQRGDDIHLTVAHFGPGLALWASEKKDGSPTWKLQALAGKRAVFENPDRAFPRRMIYERPKETELHVHLVGERDGKATQMTFAFKRK